MILLDYFFKQLTERREQFWGNYYIVERQLPEKNLLSHKVTELRCHWRATCQIHREYIQKTQSKMAWLKSFIPLSNEYNLRQRFFLTLTTANELLVQAEIATQICLHKLNISDTSLASYTNMSSKILDKKPHNFVKNKSQFFSNQRKHSTFTPGFYMVFKCDGSLRRFRLNK